MIISDDLLRSTIRQHLLNEKVGYQRADFDVDLRGEKESASFSFGNVKFEPVPTTQAVTIAEKELGDWEDKKESDESMLGHLRKYWKPLASWPEDKWKKNGKYTAWSAAFVSWVMSQVDSNWVSNAAHAVYFNDAKKNRKNIIKDPDKFKGREMWVAFKPNELELDKAGGLQPGDLVFAGREENKSATFDTFVKGPSHTDVYTGNKQGIGGNLSDRVAKVNMKKPIGYIKRIKVTGLADNSSGEALPDDPGNTGKSGNEFIGTTTGTATIKFMGKDLEITKLTGMPYGYSTDEANRKYLKRNKKGEWKTLGSGEKHIRDKMIAFIKSLK